MRFARVMDLADLLLDGFTSILVVEIIEKLNIPINVRKMTAGSFSADCHKYALDRNWDPETTLVIYTADSDKMTQILDPSNKPNDRYSAFLVQNITLEELAARINKLIKMKAFL
jgi:hypothetical protein